MVVGATGAGKSTMIDGLVNFYLDVAWEEDSRFRVIDLTPEEQKKRNEVFYNITYTESKKKRNTKFDIDFQNNHLIYFHNVFHHMKV